LNIVSKSHDWLGAKLHTPVSATSHSGGGEARDGKGRCEAFDLFSFPLAGV